MLDGNIHNVRLGNSQLRLAKSGLANLSDLSLLRRRRCGLKESRRLTETGTVDKDPQMMCAVLNGENPLVIYLCFRKRGLQVDPSGMALSHGGNSAVSRICGVHTDLRMTV